MKPKLRIPNPGSEEAELIGCICAVLDNNHGKFAPHPSDGWWISKGCPIHDPHKQNKDPNNT